MDRARAPRRLAAACLTAFLCALFAGCGLSTYGTSDPPPPEQRCSEAAHCDDGNPCTLETCAPGGVCQSAPAPDADLSEQLAGDCHTTRCVAGEVVSQVNDADVHEDGNDCTADTCVDGDAFNTAKPDQTPCAVGDAAGACDNGLCVVACGPGMPACDDALVCTTDACDAAAAQCVHTPLHGVPVPGQPELDGNCLLTLCVDGQVAPLIDDDDLPLTDTDCDLEECNAGVKSNPPRPAGTSCATDGGRVCDGAGLCVECNDPTDCIDLPADSECAVRTCVAHVCGQDLTPIGTPTSTQTPGDCQQVVCDGQGATTSIPDDADLLDDGNECTTNGCVNGTPTLENVALDEPCGQGGTLYCNGAGACVGCNDATQCPAGDFCKTTICSAQQCGFSFAATGTPLPAADQTSGDCQELRCNGAGLIVPANINDPNVDGNACTQDLCSNGTPSNPPAMSNAACTLPGGDPGVCDGASACVQCNIAAQCPGASACVVATCAMHACGTMNVDAGMPLPDSMPGDCKRPECDGNGASVIVPFSMDTPNDNNQCTSDSCSAGTPTFTSAPVGTMCMQNGGQQCDGLGACKKILGTTCAAGGECLSTFCADNVCCNAACDGSCLACSAAGSCQPAASGQQDACPNGSVCDPVGACKKTNGQVCGASAECLSGECVDSVCCNTACDTACRACNVANNLGNCVVAASGQQDLCNGNEVCSSGTCRLVNGETCAGGGQCASGFCADDVCCNAACSGTCDACNAAGMCVPVAAGQPGTCGAGSVCDASGMCKLVPGQPCSAPDECASGSCTLSVCE